MKSSIVIHPAADYPSNSAMTLRLPRGDRGVEYTIAAMRALIHDAQASPWVRATAAAIMRDAERNATTPADELYWYLRRHVHFLKDTQGVEHLRHPDVMLAQIRSLGRTAGDCDDLAVLAASLLRAMGKAPALIVMATSKQRRFHHVFYGVYDHRADCPPLPGIVPYNPQDQTAPGVWPSPIGRVKAYRV